MKPVVQNYLSLSKKEWNGMVVLVIILLLVLAAPYVYQQFAKDKTINIKDFSKDAALLQTITDENSSDGDAKQLSDTKPVTSTKFYFDPNDMTLAQWQQLG